MKESEFNVKEFSDSAAWGDEVWKDVIQVASLDDLGERAAKYIKLSADENAKYSQGMRAYLGELATKASDDAQHTDSLTGVKNRRYLDKKIGDGSLERKKHDATSVLMFDIDYFKKVNDNYGHQVGDKVLKDVSGVISKVMRRTDIFGRYGGEEFLGILPGTDLEGALVVANKINEAVRKSKVLPDGGNVTMSIGVSEVKSKKDIRGVIENADKALYKVKESGRDGAGYLSLQGKFYRN
jgi:diguanylate cyclase (GGDEF)-like protein